MQRHIVPVGPLAHRQQVTPRRGRAAVLALRQLYDHSAHFARAGDALDGIRGERFARVPNDHCFKPQELTVSLSRGSQHTARQREGN